MLEKLILIILVFLQDGFDGPLEFGRVKPLLNTSRDGCGKQMLSCEDVLGQLNICINTLVDAQLKSTEEYRLEAGMIRLWSSMVQRFNRDLPASRRSADHVKELTRFWRLFPASLKCDLLHHPLQDEETGKSAYTSSIEGEKVQTLSRHISSSALLYTFLEEK